MKMNRGYSQNVSIPTAIRSFLIGFVNLQIQNLALKLTKEIFFVRAVSFPWKKGKCQRCVLTMD